jgi:hypothetical protein
MGAHDAVAGDINGVGELASEFCIAVYRLDEGIDRRLPRGLVAVL